MELKSNQKTGNIPSNISIGRGDEAVNYSQVDGLSLQNLFETKVGVFPNCRMFSQSNKDVGWSFNIDKIYNEIISLYGIDKVQIVRYSTEHVGAVNIDEDENEMPILDEDSLEDSLRNNGYYSICVIIPSVNIYVRIESCVSEAYILYDNPHEQEMQAIANIFHKYYEGPRIEDNNLYTLSFSPHVGYDLQKAKVKTVVDFDVTKQYNDDFAKEDEKIRNFISGKTEGSGIVILHGEKGTGKTTYIKHLINIYPKKTFVFVHAGLITLLSQPEFQSFMPRLSNSVIILEDCEDAIRDRQVYGTASAVSLLLNLSDGLLSDSLNIKFICTFNADIKDIDPALTRKGRLVSKYEFKPLSVEKSNELLKDIYKDSKDGIPTVTQPTTLANLYYLKDTSYEIKTKKIGINR